MIPELNPASVSWATFGFPDPTFIPAGYGAFALQWALYERGIFFGTGNWPDKFASFVSTPDGSDFRRGFASVPATFYEDFDYALYLLCANGYYLHPDRREAYLSGTLTLEDAAWSIKELLTAAAGGDASAVIGWVDTGSATWTYEDNFRISQWRFMPQFYLPFLVQRYNAINLLRYAVPQRTFPGTANTVGTDFVIGNTIGEGYYSTLSAILAAALAASDTRTSGDLLAPQLEYYYTDGQGYSNASFRHVTRWYCNIPSGITNWSGFLGVNFTLPTGYLAPPNCPGPGYNRIASDGNGDFAVSPVYPFWNGATLATGQSATYDLSRDDPPRVYFDLSGQFRFHS